MADGDAVDVELEPRFDGRQLGWAASLLFVVVVLVILIGWKVAADLGLFSASARGVESTRVLANTVAVWLALSGVVVLFVGAFGALADLRKPKATVNPPSDGQVGAQALGGAGAAVIGTVVESLGKAFATLKGSSALIVAGIILMVTSGLLAWQSVPEAACESDLTTTQRTATGTDADDTTSFSESTSKGIGPCAATPTTTPPTTATSQPPTTDTTSPSGDAGGGTDGGSDTAGTSTGDG